MKKRTTNFKIGVISAMVLTVIALVLEALPGGAVIIFGSPDGTGTIYTYSYFSLTPFGYANFVPLITAILTVVILVMLVVYFIKVGPKKLKAAIIVVNAIAAVVSICPLVYGIDYYNVLGISITAVLCLTAGRVVMTENN